MRVARRRCVVAARARRRGRRCDRARRRVRGVPRGRQSANGGFAEQGRAPDGPLTAWAALGLVAADGSPAARARALDFLRAAPADDLDATRISPSASWRSRRSARPSTRASLARLRRHRPDVLVNATIWTVLALRAVGEQPPQALVAGDPRRAGEGGRLPVVAWGQPDSNDTAAAIQALRAAGVGGAPIRRAVAALRAFQNRDGGFCADEGPRVGRAVDRVGDPGAAQRRRAPGQGSVPVPRAPPPRRRELPLLGHVRHDAGLGDGAGAAGARRAPVPVSIRLARGAGPHRQPRSGPAVPPPGSDRPSTIEE